jgi:hypothetical protein
MTPSCALAIADQNRDTTRSEPPDCQNIFQHDNVNIPRARGANQTHASLITEKTAGDSAGSAQNPPIRLPLLPATATQAPSQTARDNSRNQPPTGAVRLGVWGSFSATSSTTARTLKIAT